MTYPIHSPALFAFREHPLEIRALLPDEERSVAALYLIWAANGVENRTRMLPVDGLALEESYSLYAATLPAQDLVGESVEYCFELDGKRGARYRVALFARELPPPLVITELCLRAPAEVAYLEIFNPTDGDVDLFDYELLIEQSSRFMGRTPFCEEPLQMLRAGECAVVRVLSADHLNRIGDPSREAPFFWDAAEHHFPDSCEELDERAPRVIAVACATKGADGVWVKSNERAMPASWQPQRYRLVKRGTDQPLYELSAHFGVKYLDVPQRDASLWSVDPLRPTIALKAAARRAGTPGFADSVQALPYFGDLATPAILPLQKAALCHTASAPSIRFAVLGGAHDIPVLFYRDGESWRSAIAEQDEAGLWQASLPRAAVLREEKQLLYYIECKGAWYTARLGSEIDPLTVSIIDDAGPEITAMYPADGEAVEKQLQPEIRVRFFDAAGVDMATSAICLDGVNVSDGAEWQAGEVRYRPAKPLGEGEHVLELVLRDMLGNRTYRRTAFLLHDGTQMRLFSGQVHSHTSRSDGSGRPQDAMAYARDEGKVDFFSVTDHCLMTTDEDLDRRHAEADLFNENGRFATLFGFEMSWLSDSVWGHMNLLNTDWHDCARATPLPEFYEKLAADEDAIAMFNHPGYKWGDFDSFRYHAGADARVGLIEIRGAMHDKPYALMLSRGWHAAPVWNEDNHKWNWTTASKGGGMVLAHSLTRENVLDAMRRGRTYATSDRSTKVIYRVNGEWLGTRLQSPDTLGFEVLVSTENEAGIGDLYLVSEDNIVVAHTQAGPLRQFSWRLELPAEFDYYYVKIQNGKEYTLTAPVFVEGRNALTLHAPEISDSGEADAPFSVCITVENTGGKDLSDVALDFYLSGEEGFCLPLLTAMESEYIGELQAGESRTVCRRFPAIAGKNRVSAVVRGACGKQRFADTTYTFLPRAIISRICPLTSELDGEENPFSFAELYNPYSVPLSLNGYALYPCHGAGTGCLEENIQPLDGLTIPAHGTVTVWRRNADSKLEIEDFNTHYGTSLDESSLLCSQKAIFQVDTRGHKLDLRQNGVPVARVCYSTYCGGAKSVPDQQLIYRYVPDLTVQEELITPTVPTPMGTPCEEQMLPVLHASSRADEWEKAKKEQESDALAHRPVKKMSPWQAAAFAANAFAAFKDLFFDKD